MRISFGLKKGTRLQIHGNEIIWDYYEYKIIGKPSNGVVTVIREYPTFISCQSKNYVVTIDKRDLLIGTVKLFDLDTMRELKVQAFIK